MTSKVMRCFILEMTVNGDHCHFTALSVTEKFFPRCRHMCARHSGWDLITQLKTVYALSTADIIILGQ